MKKYILLLIPLLFLMAQCHKTPTPEPEPPTFQNTFSCFINGKFWQAYQPPSGAVITWSPGKVWVIYDPDPKTGSIFLQGRRDTLDTKEWITISTNPGETGIGRHLLRQASVNLTSCSFLLDSTNRENNWIEIMAVDTSKHIVSGKFEAKSSISSCGSSPVLVTNGFFEVKY